MRGAFEDTLQGDTKRRLLWQHNMYEPIGVELELRSDDRGLFGRWKLSKTTRGLDTYELLKDGAVDSLSIGYRAQDFEFDDVGTRLLKKIDLMEVSIVSFPANDHALITQVKELLRKYDDSGEGSQEKNLLFDLDVPFDEQLVTVQKVLQLGTTEAEALWARRLADGREPKQAHIDAVQTLRDVAEATAAKLAALLSPNPPAEASGAGEGEGIGEETSVSGSAPSDDLSIRLEMTRHRLHMARILEQ